MPALEFTGGALLVQGGVLLAKATLVMVGALVISRTLLSRDPEARHALWTGTMVTLLLLPILSVAGVPGFAVPVPVPSTPAVAGSGEVTPTSPFLRGLPRADEGSVAMEAIPGSEASWATHPFRLRDGNGGTDRAAYLPTPVHPEALHLDGFRATPLPASGGMGERIAAGMGLFWGLGTLLFLVVLLTGILRARRLIRQARPLEAPDWQDQARSAARRVGVRRAFSLRMARRARSAMAGGLVRPVVLLPTEARSWSLDRRDVVLLHEFVHVKRHDPLRQLLDRLVVALYWFHPLARPVAREAATAREEACDRRVVELGTHPSKYATHLVELVDRRIPASAGVAGFHHPDLEKRIMSILAPSRHSSRFPALAGGVLTLTWFTVVALTTPVASQTPPTPPSAVDSVEAPPPPEQPELLSAPSPPEAPTGPEVVRTRTPPPPTIAGDTLDLWTCHAPGAEGEGARGALLKSEVDGRSTSLRTTALGEYALCLFTVGSVELTERGLEPGSLAPGASVEVVVASSEGSQRLRIEADPAGALQEHWFVNGEAMPMTPEVEAWSTAVLRYLHATRERSSVLVDEARLRGELARLHGERARFAGEIARARGELARLEGSRSRAMAEEARLRAEVARVQAETARLRAELMRTDDPDAMRALEEAIEAQSRRARERAAEVEARIEALDTEARVAALDAELDDLRDRTSREVETLSLEMEAHEAEHEARTRQLEDAIAVLQTQARLDEIDALLTDLRARAVEAIESIGFDTGSR